MVTIIGSFLGIYLNTSDQALAQNSVSYRVMSLMSVIYLMLFPLSSTVLPTASGAIVTLIIISSISLYLFPLKGARHINHEERLFYFSVSFIVIVAILATVLSGMEYSGMKKMGKFVYLLMVIPVYYYFRTVRVKPCWVWYGLIIGALVSAIVGVYEVANDIYKPGYSGRAKGATHPIIFGDLSLVIGAMSLAGWGWFKEQNRWQVVLPVVAVAAGILASLLSQSRGGWVAIPFMMAVFVWVAIAHVSRVKIVTSIVGLILCVLIAYQVPQTGLEKRLNITVTNIEKYINADEKSMAGGTSVTSRFEMWQASWSIFLDNPLVGVGWGNYQENAKQLVQSGERNWTAAGWDHPHNQFISAMVSGGIFALLAIILLFFIPAQIFYKACKSSQRSIDARRMALAGLILMVGFSVFNMSESFLERSRTISFFIFYLAVFMAGIRETNTEAINHK